MVTILREGDEEGVQLPQPGVEAIATLVEEVSTVGLDVDLRTEGEPQPLPPGLDLAAYRIVQEALTNVRDTRTPLVCRSFCGTATGRCWSRCTTTDEAGPSHPLRGTA